MTISVLMSTYNGEQYITTQLESLLNQSMKIDEVVIIDDCSLDNTVSVVREFIKSHGLEMSWKAYKNEKNVGWRVNFMQGIQKTTGDILLFSDQDDIWLENKVEAVTRVLKENPQIQVAASNETLWTGEPVENMRIMSSTYDLVELDATGKDYFILCSGCTMAIRRTYINRVLKYHKMGWAHDDFFWKMAGIDGALALIRESTILHRIHGANESRKNRTLAATLTGIQTDLMVAEQLLQYLRDGAPDIRDAQTKTQVVEHKMAGSTCRLQFFQTKRPGLLLKLAFRYSDIYRKKRQILKDFLLAWQGD